MSNFGLTLTALAALMTAAANLLLQQGVKQSSQFANGAFWNLMPLFSNVSFWAGGILYGLSLLTWLKILALEPIGAAYPILIGLTFALLMSGAAFLAHEPISLKTIVGTLIILAGITIVARP